MPRSRILLSLIPLTCLATSCRLFRPYNPNAPKTEPVKPAEVQPSAQAIIEAPPPPLERRRDVGTVSDATIAAMLLASNNTDISYARLVPSRAERKDIKDFAARMLTDHAGVNAMLNELLAKLDLTPEDNNASLDMRDVSAANRDKMRDLNGYAFDSTYIENEITYHRRFLSDLDDIMIRKSRDRDLGNLLNAVRPAVAAHLAHAEQIRANVLLRK
jgi:putative membrane protein